MNHELLVKYLQAILERGYEWQITTDEGIHFFTDREYWQYREVLYREYLEEMEMEEEDEDEIMCFSDWDFQYSDEEFQNIEALIIELEA